MLAAVFEPRLRSWAPFRCERNGTRQNPFACRNRVPARSLDRGEDGDDYGDVGTKSTGSVGAPFCTVVPEIQLTRFDV